MCVRFVYCDTFPKNSTVDTSQLLCRVQDGTNRIISDEDDIIERLEENDDASADDDNRGKCIELIFFCEIIIPLFLSNSCL